MSREDHFLLLCLLGAIAVFILAYVYGDDEEDT